MLEALQDIIIQNLAVSPVGIFALAGLLGGAAARIGQARQRASAAGGQSGGPGPGRASTTAAVESEPQETARQTAAQTQAVRQPEQPPQKSALADLAPKAGEEQTPQAVQKKVEQEKIKVTDGLLADTKPMADAPEPKKGEMVEAQEFVNRTDDDTPISRPSEEMFGEVPQVEKPDGVENQLFMAGTNEQPFEFQSGLPDRDISGTLADSEEVAPQGYAYKQTTTVSGGLPARRYGIRG